MGWVKLEYQGEDGGSVRVTHAEVLAEDNSSLSYNSAGGDDQIQTDTYINIPHNAILEPEFDWHGFRYFQVYGDARPLEVVVVHTDIPVTSSFDSDNEMLNWLYKTMINTFLCNAHLGVPSDCPHRERLGYTGTASWFVTQVCYFWEAVSSTKSGCRILQTARIPTLVMFSIRHRFMVAEGALGAGDAP